VHVKAAVQDLIDVHDARSKEVAAQKAAEAELREGSAHVVKEVKTLKKTLYDVQDNLAEHQRALHNLHGD
jgi:seryl-tRNA synthetase